MDAGAFHIGKFAHGARQFALQGALVVDALHEVGLTHLHGVEDFKTDALAHQAALARDFDAHVVHVVGGHHDGGAVVRQLVADFFGLEHVDHPLGVLGAQLGVQYAKVGTAEPEHEPGEHREHEYGEPRHENALGAVEFEPEFAGFVEGQAEIVRHGKSPGERERRKYNGNAAALGMRLSYANCVLKL